MNNTRRLARLPFLLLLVLPALLVAQAAKKTPPKTTTGAGLTAPTFPLKIATEFLGMVKEKTVVRVTLTSPELAAGLRKVGIEAFRGDLHGTFLKDGVSVVDEFDYPVAGELSEGAAFRHAFLRAVPPGTYKLSVVLKAAGHDVAESAVEVAVPEVGETFRAEMAPGETGTLPTAEAILLAEEAAGPRPEPGTQKLKLLPPDKEAPIGRLRLEAEVEEPIVRVEFWLGDKKILTRTRPPYTVELDLGEIPRRQTVRAVGYDAGGAIIDEDVWAVNEGKSRIAVRVLPILDHEKGLVRIKVAVQSIGGGQASRVEAYLDDKKIGAWGAQGPYETTVSFKEYERASYLRATAYTEDGGEANDMRALRGSSTALEVVTVDVVQLHVSALNKEGHFVKGLARDDFSVKEDGAAQNLTGFEVAENLPLTAGMVIDASGSMEDSLAFVHDAGAGLFKNLIREKDQGFVIEFNEQPRFLEELTKDSASLQRAARSSKARGGTALYDAIVLGLYQFRTLQGRKALVVVTDGADNRSHVDADTLARYVRSAGAPVYFIAVSIPITDFTTRRIINRIAEESGGLVFHLSGAAKIAEVTRQIEEELRSQYILAFRSSSQKPQGEYRAIAVAVAKPGITARTVRGYIP
ncbi:MAG TPA: VWA domain-containing protein [Thermoanaerobaculia bacterium]